MASLKNPRFLLISLIVSLLLNAVAFSEVFFMLKQNENLSSRISTLAQETDNLQKQLEYYRSQAEHYSSLLKRLEANNSVVGKATVNIVAVKTVGENIFEVSYEGLTLTCTVELKIGEGRILINTVPRIGIDLQTSSQIAVSVAEKLTGTSLGNTDVIFTIEAEEEVDVVDGPSAGAAITIATIAAIKGEKPSRRVFITGTIRSDGSIGKVGGVLEKAEAAAAKGADVFLVPKGQGRVLIYQPVKRSPFPGLVVITYKQVEVNLEEYLRNEGYSITIHEAVNITEAYQYFLSSS